MSAADTDIREGTPAAPAPSPLMAAAIVGLLTLGSFALLLGWAAGVALLWTRSGWPRRHRLVATFVVPGGPAVAVLLARAAAAATSFSCSGGVGGESVGLAGPASGPAELVATTCTAPALPGAVGAAAAAVLIVASVAAPTWAALAATRRRQPSRGSGHAADDAASASATTSASSVGLS